MRLVASAGVGSGGWGCFPEGVWAGDHVAALCCAHGGVLPVLRPPLISVKRCGGRCAALVVSQRGWWWIGTPRLWYRSPDRHVFMTRWRHCSQALRIRPIILLPRRPDSEGQVERTIGYLEGSFLPLRSFSFDRRYPSSA